MTKKKKRSPGNRRKTGGAVAIVEAGKATRFQPGQSGNLAGRPRNVISVEMKRMLGEMCPLHKDGSTWAQAIARVVLSKALRGDIRYVEVVFDRVEGKAHQAISFSGAVEIGPPVSVEETKERLNRLVTKIRDRQKSEKETEKQKQPRALPN
jgi:Family of unknown function (DUF5681)